MDADDCIPWKSGDPPERTAEAALEDALAIFRRRGFPTSEGDGAPAAGYPPGYAEQEREFYAWAASAGRLISPIIQRRVATAGSEHQVYFEPAVQRYIKIGGLGFGKTPRLHLDAFLLGHATPAEYLRRLQLQNEIFGDAIELLGAVYESGRTYPVISQPNIPGEPPSADQIGGFMRQSEFRQIGRSEWFRDSDGISVVDFHPANARVHQHQVLPIDVIVTIPMGRLRAVLSATLPDHG